MILEAAGRHGRSKVEVDVDYYGVGWVLVLGWVLGCMGSLLITRGTDLAGKLSREVMTTRLDFTFLAGSTRRSNAKMARSLLHHSSYIATTSRSSARPPTVTMNMYLVFDRHYH